MYKKYIYLGVLPLIFFLLSAFINPASAVSQNYFQVLVDTNLLFPSEAVQASRFAADGVWSIPHNSDRYGTIDWSATLKTLNAQKWNVSEDNPNSTDTVDYVSNVTGRMVDGAMFYIENRTTATIIPDTVIQQNSTHVVPGFGPVGKRIIILGRTFQEGYPTQLTFKHALQNPLVSGGAFEFKPSIASSGIRVDVGCQFVLSLGKKCYFLIPPGTQSDYLTEVQNLVGYIKNHNNGLLNNPDFYIVLAAYNRDYNGHNPIHYVSTGAGDRHSFEAVVKWLNEYRHIKPTPTPTPTPRPTSTPTPTSTSASTAKPGDLNADGKVDIYDYNLLVGSFGKTGSNVIGDIDKNGKVDIFDYNTLVGNFGK